MTSLSSLLLFAFLAIGVTARAKDEAPNKEMEIVCPGAAAKCPYKIEKCLKQQILSEDVMLYMRLYQQNMKICKGKVEEEEMDNMDKRIACAIQNMHLVVDNKVNRPLLKRVIVSSFGNSSQILQTAIADAVDTCPEIPDPETISDYYLCLLKACVDALDKEMINAVDAISDVISE